MEKQLCKVLQPDVSTDGNRAVLVSEAMRASSALLKQTTQILQFLIQAPTSATAGQEADRQQIPTSADSNRQGETKP